MNEPIFFYIHGTKIPSGNRDQKLARTHQRKRQHPEGECTACGSFRLRKLSKCNQSAGNPRRFKEGRLLPPSFFAPIREGRRAHSVALLR